MNNPSTTPLPTLSHAYADRESILLLIEEMEDSWEVRENRTPILRRELERAHFFLRYLQHQSFPVPFVCATGTGGVLFEWTVKTWTYHLYLEPEKSEIVAKVHNTDGYHKTYEFHDEQAAMLYIMRLFDLLAQCK